MTRVAAIDCGTNTIRLLIAEATRTAEGQVLLEPIDRRNQIVRLGQGVDRTGQFDPDALERTLQAVAGFARRCEELGAQHRRFVATSATRDARNRQEFIAGVREQLGVEPEVISGQEEARLSFSGSLLGAAPADGPRLVVDLGGGSTELVLGLEAPQAAISLDTGSVRITERFLTSGVSVAAEAAARAEVRGLLDEAAQVVDLSAAHSLVGLAGTITTVTSHALGCEGWQPERVSGAVLPVNQVLASCEALLHSTPGQREAMTFLSVGRRDVIAAGALIWSEVVQRVVEATAATSHPVTETVTSTHDILDGIALDLAQRIV
ncbi:Guanosine-5'-triphosphate,3'-diphosphate pyrophosphatase [Actinomyces bovis]|uniref:Guanosine-5'-triphosphate,3'-diphosphate pyrophosphatase n=1 Tax=Actinomyces bovis TaxID=1658 RepID=A0ABY1VQ14_9ACTO|nr:exopolyphosphatase [Actinomyces bovis]SPT53143.1 Guanosine-5'-triphosphate,3'-diphosphate pyrophosphatase [Actinomyces bovis]VEG52309.1 Guanosine-5'-triphosphate,3'-diphosphate pyrophosphatase [Actinomyces israelii]